ncbi:S53 family peptidase [Archangium gephyra]|nr:S53 family peptidase [Archangium gephyra]
MLVPGARVLRAAHENEWLEVTVRLRRRRPLPSVDDLGMRPIHQRQHLRHEQFQTTYGAHPEDVSQVEAFAAAHGLRVQGKELARRSVVLGGTVSSFNRAFSTRLMHYEHPDGAFRGRVGPLSLPAELEGVVTGVFGLDTHRLIRHHPRPRPLRTSHALVTRELPQVFSIPDLATLYNFPEGDGAGQCVGLLEFGGGYFPEDVEQSARDLGLPMPEVVAVSVDGVRNTPSRSKDPRSSQGASTGEVELDMEVVGALVPLARQAVYFSDFTEKGWVDSLAAAIHDTENKPSVLSISWGFSEMDSIWTPACMEEVNELLQEAATLGITVCVASGDDGSEAQEQDGYAHVVFPASSPYALAVGGTTLLANGGAITEEKVWNTGSQLQPGGGAGGGGISAYFARPSWQGNAQVPASVNPGHRLGRGVPDVAANADPYTGYLVVSKGERGAVGGTSAAAPLWASLIARLNQQLGRPVGYLNPLLYASLGRVGCNDITVGTNDPTFGRIGGYAAGPGWDACTGWGSPNGQRLLATLRGTSEQGF